MKNPKGHALKVPHMGWNELEQRPASDVEWDIRSDPILFCAQLSLCRCH